MKTAILFLLLPTLTFAQTYVTGGIYTNTTWTIAGSPYVVSDSLTLFQGVTLVINPGVTVKFNDNIQFEVRGTLNAIGTTVDSVVFTSSSTTPHKNSWDGIYFHTALGASIHLAYCKLEYARMPIRIGFSSNPLTSTITNSTFQNNSTCIGGYTSQNFLTVDKCVFKKNTYGIGETSWAAGRITPRNCVFTDNEIGIYYTQTVNPINCIFRNNKRAIAVWGAIIDSCSIIDNVVGIYDIHPYDRLEVLNSTVACNDTGIILDGESSSVDAFINVAICNNRNFNVVHTGNYNVVMNNICWCDTNPNSIGQKIFDGYDDSNLGLVTFSQLGNCDLATLSEFAVCARDSNLTGSYAATFSSSQMKIFPNPFNNQVTVHVYHNEQTTVSLFNYLGQQILQQTFTNSTTINTEQLADGIYFYELYSDKGVIANGKIIRQ